jgi:pyrroline-5-carboxylate reductase
MRVAVLGGGRMGEALVGGLLDSGWKADDVAVAEAVPARLRELEQRFPGVRVGPSPAWVVPDASVVVVAVKPGDVSEALGAAATALDHDTLVLSIAAGVRIAAIEEVVPGLPVVRAMPNTPALVRKGAAAIAPGTHAGDEHLRRAEAVLGAVGLVVRVPEYQLDAVTGLSGSGPAYVFLFVEALIEAGVLAGLPRDVARTLAVQTLAGSAALLTDDSDASPEALRAGVTSPGGTTAAGLRVLEQRGVRAAVLDAVAAATDRSRELGQA